MRTGFLARGNDLLGMESLHFYQNTFITETWSGSYAGRTWTTTHPRTRRSVLNNLFVYLNRYPDSAKGARKNDSVFCNSYGIG